MNRPPAIAKSRTNTGETLCSVGHDPIGAQHERHYKREFEKQEHAVPLPRRYQASATRPGEGEIHSEIDIRYAKAPESVRPNVMRSEGEANAGLGYNDSP